MTSLFISDLHLDKKRPEVIKFFINFMIELDSKIESLYILGDFIEYWVGDDDPADGLTDIFNVIKKKSDSLDIYIMHGNRDFMLSENFCKKFGMKLLKDPTIIEIDNKKIMLMHGDTLCIDDKSYQEFRAMVRSDKWQKEMLKKPLKKRLELAKTLRERSLAATDVKDEIIMDVNQKEVVNVFQSNDIDLIIHGHTHRPNIHKLSVNNKDVTRIVLGDWYTKSFILKIENSNITIEKNSLI